MTRTVALALLLASAAGARAEQWCISRTGRLRLRPNDCMPTERATTLPAATGGGAKSLAVVDRDGDLVGYAVGSRYELTYADPVFMRQVGPDTVGLPMNDRGLVPPGSDVLYFSEPGCVGTPLVPDYGASRNGLLKVGPVWPDTAWYATGASAPATAQSYVVPPLPTAPCDDYSTGHLLADGFCCVEGAVPGSFYAATAITLDGLGLEPPVRLSMEP